jgi:hypothetical protein
MLKTSRSPEIGDYPTAAISCGAVDCIHNRDGCMLPLVSIDAVGGEAMCADYDSRSEDGAGEAYARLLDDLDALSCRLTVSEWGDVRWKLIDRLDAMR